MMERDTWEKQQGEGWEVLRRGSTRSRGSLCCQPLSPSPCSLVPWDIRGCTPVTSYTHTVQAAPPLGWAYSHPPAQKRSLGRPTESPRGLQGCDLCLQGKSPSWWGGDMGRGGRRSLGSDTGLGEGGTQQGRGWKEPTGEWEMPDLIPEGC